MSSKTSCCSNEGQHNNQHHGDSCCGNTSGDIVNRTVTLEGMHGADCAVKLERSVSRIQTQSQTNQTSVYRIDGMDCADCALKLEKRVGSLPAVHQVTVNYGAAKMTVEHDGTASQSIMQTVQQAGYTAMLDAGDARPTDEVSFWRRNKKVLPTCASGLLFAIAWGLSWGAFVDEIYSTILYAAAIGIGGFRMARTGFYGLKSRTIGMDLLMTVAAAGAALIGQWEEGAAVVFLFSLGETLEAYTMDRTRKSIRGLMDLSPKEALVRREGHESMMGIEDIRIGDTVIIKPGEKIAVDGVIIKGASSINQAPITGESIPVDKAGGDEVYAGTMNQQGAIEVEVTKLSKDNTLSRIITMVEDAQAQKAPSQRFVDTFSKYYTPAVLILAVGIAVIPPVFLAQPFHTWIYRSLMMLVVSCPCALVISTPVSIVSAIGNAARNGILIKGGAHLERLGAVSVVAFDKTGTLTAGMPQVTAIIALDGQTEEEALSIAAGMESSSEHPVAEAIVRFAEQKGIQSKEISSFTSVTGRGVKATVQGEGYFIGSPKWFADDLNVSMDGVHTQINHLEQQGQTVMMLGTRERLIAMIAVADEVRPNSKSTLEQLGNIGIKKTIMLTGDNRGTAQAVAAKLGGIEYDAELLPQDKVSSVKQLMTNYGHVAMLGDGVNDAPALATATVGIAMGAAGTDTALETADVALMADNLSKLPYAIRLSRRALRIIKQNIAFSLLIKVVFLVMIFLGTSTLWMAVLADTGSSLLVIANGMRLLQKNKPLS
ncbi:heavy metal translocating P-type ATPase [Paenibacillus sp. MAHUQ-63]|nr:heavy metal translocating P-type ATPase [Paenibacillus sp. MAHUQ-63]MDD9267077.1 heavy metal translocating P-type ATPase [Paenibacillus sp. MAHUQ-63]